MTFHRLVLFVAAWLACAAPTRADDQPPGLPGIDYHLTARPFEPLDIAPEVYLDALADVCRYLATLQDKRGAIIDPFLGREHQYATPYFAHPVGVLLAEGRTPELRAAGVRAMEHSTACLAAGSRGIPDQHGEFFIAPLVEALELYRGQVDESLWQSWQERLRTPLSEIMQDQHGRTNNWRTYAMKGQWLRHRAGLVERDETLAFIADAWLNRTQRERIAADKWNLYQDWSSDPQSHSVEAVGRGNLLALVAAGYDGPQRKAIQSCVRRGSRSALLWQSPAGDCPPNGRTDNHVFGDVLYQLTNEVMAQDVLARGHTDRAGQFRRAALLAFDSFQRWRRTDGKFAGSYFVTKNRFDPAERVGYQPASQFTNYNGAVAYHLAEAFRARRSPISQRPAPSEIGGYVVTADPRFASAVANAGGMQMMANLRGDTVPKYGVYWTPLGVVRFARTGWDSRLGPLDGVHDAATSRAATFGPTWLEAGRWVRLAERADDYRGTISTEFVHPLLVRFHILYHPVTGRGGPTFRHEFVVTPDGVLASLLCNEDRPFGLTVPLMVDDGRPLEVNRTPPVISASYPNEVEPSGDEQSFLLLGEDPVVHADKPIRSAVGWLEPLRVTGRGDAITVFVYPRSATDPAASEVLASFKMQADGFESCLGRVAGNLYCGRTSAGGHAAALDLNSDGVPELRFNPPCGFLVQLKASRPTALETDRRTQVRHGGGAQILEKFVPGGLAPESD